MNRVAIAPETTRAPVVADQKIEPLAKSWRQPLLVSPHTSAPVAAPSAPVAPPNSAYLAAIGVGGAGGAGGESECV